MVLTAALVLDNVLMAECAQDVDLPPPARVELRAAARLESLHGHHLASAFVGWVIAVQADLAKVTLTKTGDGQPHACLPGPCLHTGLFLTAGPSAAAPGPHLTQIPDLFQIALVENGGV